MSFATGPMMEDVNAQPTTLMQMPPLALHSPYQMHGYGLSGLSALPETSAQPAAGSLFQYAAPTAVQHAVPTVLTQVPTQSLYSVAPPGQLLAQPLAQNLHPLALQAQPLAHPLAQNLHPLALQAQPQPLAHEHDTATGQLGWSVEPVANTQKISEESRLKTYKSPEAMAKEMFSSDSADVHLPHVHQGMLNHKQAIETLGAQHKTVVANSKAAIKTLSKQGKLLDQQDVGLKSQKSAILTMQKELGRLGRDLDAVRSVRSRSEGPPSMRRNEKQDPVKTKAAAAPVPTAGKQNPVRTKTSAEKELADTKSQLVALAQKLDRLETGAQVDIPKTAKTAAPKAEQKLKRPNRTKAVQITEVDTGAAIARVGRPRSKANRTWVE